MLKKPFILLIALLAPAPLPAADISNPLRLMFAADAVENLIDVIDAPKAQTVFRIPTAHRVDDLAATPHAPLLLYTNIERRLVSIYDLRRQALKTELELPMSPRHLVMDAGGSRVAFTDSVDGGFVLLSAYAGEILFTLPDFPPTSDVLFDPNEIDIYYSNDETGALGIIDTNSTAVVEIPLADAPGQKLSSPSRSLDSRYIYVANESTGEVYSLNAFSNTIYRSFAIGERPMRPYTTPDGVFLYMADRASGRFVSVEQNRFEIYEDMVLGPDIDLVAVGQFDRMNLLASSANPDYYFYDNLQRRLARRGRFDFTPLAAYGSLDGKTAYVAFRDSPAVAIVGLDNQQIEYIAATENGIGAFSVGLSNNVCH